MHLNINKTKIINEMIEKIELMGISSIKTTIIGLLDLINSDSSSAVDLQQLIELDPPLVSIILKRANSALFAHGKKINTIKDAVIWIGFEQVKEIALTQKVFDFFQLGDKYGNYSGMNLWKHSVSVALFAKFIFRREFREVGHLAYTAGLLHDIGIILENQVIKDRFKKVVIFSHESGKPLYEIENNFLNFNHAELSAAMAEKWSFPEELKQVLKYHHNPLKAEKRYKKLIDVIYLSDYLSLKEKIGFNDLIVEKEDDLIDEINTELNMNEFSLGLLVEDVKAEIEKLRNEGLF